MPSGPRRHWKMGDGAAGCIDSTDGRSGQRFFFFRLLELSRFSFDSLISLS